MIALVVAVAAVLALQGVARAAQAVVALASIGNGLSFTDWGYTSALDLMNYYNVLDRSGRVQLRLFLQTGTSEIPILRSRSLSMALRDPSVTHLLFADGDIEFKPTDVERLLAFDADVASVPALLHRFKPEYEDVMEATTAGVVLPGLAFERNVHLFSSVELKDHDRAVDGFIRVKSVGFGLVLAKRHVAEELLAFFPDTWIADAAQGVVPCVFCMQGLEGGGAQSPNDYTAFAERVRALGWDIWADTTRVVGHTGRLSFDSRSFYSGLPPVAVGFMPWGDVSAARKALPDFY